MKGLKMKKVNSKAFDVKEQFDAVMAEAKPVVEKYQEVLTQLQQLQNTKAQLELSLNGYEAILNRLKPFIEETEASK
jgi:chaperonin cofactor prefoldin